MGTAKITPQKKKNENFKTNLVQGPPTPLRGPKKGTAIINPIVLYRTALYCVVLRGKGRGRGRGKRKKTKTDPIFPYFYYINQSVLSKLGGSVGYPH